MARARRAMIDSQLRVSGVNDVAVLAGMATLPREAFVPEARRAAAYTDRAQPLGTTGGGEARVLNPPLGHGQMLVEAQPTAQDRALLVGGGTGYLAALLEPMVGSLQVVESSAELAAAAPVQAGAWTVGPLAEGAAAGAPYSLIMIDGAIEQLPDSLAAQLDDKGRVVTGLIQRGVTRLAIGRKAAGAVGFLTLAEIDLAPLAEFAAPRRWSF
jgi:protein-L-isoaspartate(D-aspartate) O-methyltransferase